MIQHQNSSDLAYVERDLSADKSLLRDPLYLSPEEENMYVRTGMMSHASQDNVLDFTDPNGESIWKEKVILNEGWTWFADNKDNDKYGFMANNITGGQHIAFSITGGDHGLVEVSVLSILMILNLKPCLLYRYHLKLFFNHLAVICHVL